MPPELLAPAGSLDAVRAAVANGADSVYLGTERFNARDEGAQLTLEELGQACRIAHQRGVRVYLTLNTLVKPDEVADCVAHLGACIDRGVDAAIVHDAGLVGLIRQVYPGFELHGSTQMTVHDPSGAAFVEGLGVQRVVLARENTLEDIRAIREAVPHLGLEAFVHGALCISYSGQCLMSGMISERSANRGSCAQSCRKDYVLTDTGTGAELDRGYLISARDLSAHEHLPSIVDLGIVSLKVEGRKKKAEYVATVTRTYRDLLDRLERGDRSPATAEQTASLVQIFSRGFTAGMLGGRAGRGYVTRTHSDNHGTDLGVVIGSGRDEVTVLVQVPLMIGDGVGFEPPGGKVGGDGLGFSVDAIRADGHQDGAIRQALHARIHVPIGWRVVRTFDARLIEQARASFAGIAVPDRLDRHRIDVRLFGSAGAPLKAVFTAGSDDAVVHSQVPLAPASKHSLDEDALRAQLGRFGGSEFVLGTIDRAALVAGLFLPVSELNRMRQRATEELSARREWMRQSTTAERTARIAAVVDDLAGAEPPPCEGTFTLSANVFTVDDARAAASAGATEVVFDPFLRHPVPPRGRIRALAAELANGGVTLRLRTPTIVRPAERRALDAWLAIGLPVLCGHAGLSVELATAGRDVVADYAVNVFNSHTAAVFFRRGVRRVVASVELTGREIGELASPWTGRGIDVVVYGRPEGMILEHCVLSAAFDREMMTCRDLCVQKHPVVTLTDPTGYTFPVATDSACRNRLLHSRPIEGSEYIESLWRSGIRGFHLLFNVAGDPIADLVARYRGLLDALVESRNVDWHPVRDLVGSEFTRGHFARAV